MPRRGDEAREPHEPHGRGEEPEAAVLSSAAARASLGICLPSMHMATVKAPFGIERSIASPSRRSAAAISESEGLSGSLVSGSSRSSKRQSAPRRFSYSAKAALPSAVTAHVVQGIRPLKPLVTVMYPAFCSLSICTLRLPAVAPVRSRR